MKITVKENDINDILQTFRELLLSSSAHLQLEQQMFQVVGMTAFV